ncbi:MAG: hypothetical protein JRJ87_19335, partial [Deltaproteobacteria bacterium]|nr:hypothetical protein [Deltaproteobacteria bacterium]
LEPGNPQAHSICPQSDDDWWVFTLDANSRIVLETFGQYGDTVMWLYDENLNEVAYDDDGGSDLFSRIEIFGLMRGRYYVMIQEFSDWGIIETYFLHLTTITSCIPDCSGRECGPDPICGEICGYCEPGWFCTAQGTCTYSGHREGAGDPCGFYDGCPADWNAAYTCVEYPGTFDGICSYPCDGPDDCAVDFPGGCCRQLASDYSVCLPGDLCFVDHPGYLDECNMECLPDMFCLSGSSGGYEDVCIFTCDLSMGVCPMGGACLDPSEGSSTGFCIPQGDGQFADACSMVDGCQSGLVCLPLDENHPGYCNRLCSSLLPCPSPFQCLLDDGQGGFWCVALCGDDSDCSVLGDWSCVVYVGGQGVCLPN